MHSPSFPAKRRFDAWQHGLIPAVLLACLLGTTTAAVSAPLELQFHTRRLSSFDGPGQSSIQALLQDENGFIWLGCQDGLQRYDGYRFELYRPDPFNPDALPHGLIQSLFEDGAGNLWIGTRGGLSRLDPASSQFIAQDGDLRDRWNVTAIAEDERGFLWFGTLDSGIVRLTPDRQTQSSLNERSRPELPSRQVTALRPADDGSLWIGFKDAGLGRLTPAGQFEHVLPGSGTRRSVSALTSDDQGRLWIGFERGGVGLLSGLGADLEVFANDPQDPDSLIHDQVETLLVDQQSRLWVGTRGGLDLLREDGRGFTHFQHRPYDPTSLAHNHVRTLLEDRSGLIWVGSAAGGVTLINTRSRFATVRNRAADDTALTLPSNVVRTLLEDSDSRLWVGTDGGGVVRRAADGGPLRAPLGSPPFPEARIWSLLEDRQGRMWIGGDNALYRMGGDGLETFRHEPEREESIGPGSVRSMAQDEAGRMWIAHFGGGLSRLARGEQRFEHFRHDPDLPFNLVSDLTLYLFFDQRQQLWIGTADGLSRRTADGRFHTYRHDAGDRTSLLGDIVRHIYQDGDGNLWVGTDAGLNRLPADRVPAPPVANTNNRGFTHYTEADGLANNTVYAILEDEDKRLWLSTNRGLSRFDPATEAFVNFDLHDGLQGLEFNGAAALRASDGGLYFGGANGYNAFYPREIEQNPFRPPVVFTRLTTLRNSVTLEGPIWRAEELVIPHEEPLVSLDFAALDYSHSASNRYAYRVDGLDDAWTELGTNNSLTLTHLDPGSYTLQVRGSNGDGVWNEKGTSIRLEVLPKPWLSPWAKGLYGLLALIGGYFLWRVRKYRRIEEQENAERIRARERRMTLALLGSGDAVWDWDLRSGDIYRTHLAEMLEYEPSELPETEDLREVLVHPDDLPEVERTIADLLRGNGEDRFELEYRMLHRSGEYRWILDRGKIVRRDDDGKAQRIAGTFKDISARKQMESKLRLWSSVFESVDEGVAVLDTEGRVEAANPALCAIADRRQEDLIGIWVEDLADDGQWSLYRRIRHAMATEGAWEGEVRRLIDENEERVFDVSFKSVLDPKGRRSHIVMVASDITQRKAAEEDLLYLANYDVLTGLPNRSHFQRTLSQALEAAEKNERRVALLFGDLDQFKQVNDTLGHAVGDLLLQESAQRLLSSVRHNDFVARLGGDELIVLLENVEELSSVVKVADRILAAFEVPFLLEDHELTVSTSLGISVFPDDGQDAQALLKFADTAMYEAKAAGRNCYSFYDKEMSARAIARMSLDNRLRHALQHDELTLLFQPKLDLGSGEINGVEAMVRWPQPDGVALTPKEFLPVAEDTGLIVPLGLWVIEQACAQAVSWRERGLDLEMSVNVSSSLLDHEELSADLKRILNDSGMEPRRLTLELTEEILMTSSESNQTLPADLKALGVRLSLDDFGTGYSSLGRLRDLPIDELKIDGSFVRAIEEQATVPRTILAMAAGLGLEVVAEGVETEEQLKMIREEGCRRVQGYVISMPVAADRLEGFMRSPDPPWSSLVHTTKKKKKGGAGRRGKLRAVD